MGELMTLVAVLVLAALTISGRQKRKRACGHGSHAHQRGTKHRHDAWLSIDYFAYASKLRSWSPGFKAIFSILTIVCCITLNNAYVSLVVILTMAFLVIELGGLSLHDYLSVLTIPLVFILVSILAIVVDGSAQPTGEFRFFLGVGYLYTTPRMLKTGFVLMLKMLASISALQGMILTTPSTELISVLRKTHLPAILLDLMNLIYRYIFILLEVFGNMKNSAESRLGYRDFQTSCRTFGAVAGNMLVLSLKKAGAYYDAMEARCYDGELLFLEEDKNVKRWQVGAAAAFFCYLILLWFLTR
jgi:cobalt/nickel transport system permease protein